MVGAADEQVNEDKHFGLRGSGPAKKRRCEAKQRGDREARRIGLLLRLIVRFDSCESCELEVSGATPRICADHAQCPLRKGRSSVSLTVRVGSCRCQTHSRRGSGPRRRSAPRCQLPLGAGTNVGRRAAEAQPIDADQLSKPAAGSCGQAAHSPEVEPGQRSNMELTRFRGAACCPHDSGPARATQGGLPRRTPTNRRGLGLCASNLGDYCSPMAAQ